MNREVLLSAVAFEVNLLIVVEESSDYFALSLSEIVDLCLMSLNLESITKMRF